MPEPTPGETAYEAVYRQWRHTTPGEDHYGDAGAYAWHRQVTGVRAAWEAAAEAVLAQAQPQEETR